MNAAGTGSAVSKAVQAAGAASAGAGKAAVAKGAVGTGKLFGVPYVDLGMWLLVAAGVVLYFNALKRKAPKVKAVITGINVVLIVALLAAIYVLRFVSASLLEVFAYVFLFNLVLFWAFGIIEAKAERRAERLEEQLVDALLILSGSLKAGRTLEQGFELVAKSLPDPISTEFQTVLQDQNLGIPFDESLKRLMGRVTSRDFKLFVTATLFQRETGGNIISLYDQITTAVAERKKLRGKIDSITVQGRYSGYLIAILPLGLFMMMAAINSDYVRVFNTEPLAKLLFVFAIFLEITGVLVVRNIVNRKLG